MISILDAYYIVINENTDAQDTTQRTILIRRYDVNFKNKELLLEITHVFGTITVTENFDPLQ